MLNGSDPDWNQSCGTKLFAKVTSRRQKSLLVMKKALLTLFITVNFPLYIDTISMDYSILSIRGHRLI